MEPTVFPVQRLGHIEALQEHEPSIVLVAWMSYDTDLTEAIRQTPSVREYILIGEVDHGASGIYKKTWIDHPGWQRFHLDDVSIWQVARTNTPCTRFTTETVVFRRTT